MPDRQWIRWALVGFVIVGLIVAIARPSAPSTTLITIGDHQVTAELAVNEQEWQKGLSGRKTIAQNEGMLFVFLADETWPIWMKDMSIPLDIIWLNSDKQVVYIAKNVQPDSYPTKFTPDTPARFVLEVVAGTTDAQNIVEGTVATFTLPSE